MVVHHTVWLLVGDSIRISYIYIMISIRPISNGQLRPWPNLTLPQHAGKTVQQWNFCTLPLFNQLHTMWYRWDSGLNMYVKILPVWVHLVFTTVALAYWIMDDGYWAPYTVLGCCENFTKAECIRLQSMLLSLGLESSLTLRNRERYTYRIRISKSSTLLIRELVLPHLRPEFLYKIGM